MSDIPTTEPELVYAGETIQWTQSFSDYPATEYTLKYYFNGPGTISTISAVAYNTTDYLISVTSATSAAWVYGIYSWQKFAEKGAGASAEKWFLGSGFITVKTAAGKSFAKTMLDAIESILTGAATSKDLDVVAKSLGGDAITRDRSKLIEMRDKFRQEYLLEVESERALQGQDTGRLIRFRFRTP